MLQIEYKKNGRLGDHFFNRGPFKGPNPTQEKIIKDPLKGPNPMDKGELPPGATKLNKGRIKPGIKDADGKLIRGKMSNKPLINNQVGAANLKGGEIKEAVPLIAKIAAGMIAKKALTGKKKKKENQLLKKLPLIK